MREIIKAVTQDVEAAVALLKSKGAAQLETLRRD